MRPRIIRLHFGAVAIGAFCSLLQLATPESAAAESLSVPLRSQIESFVRSRAEGPFGSVELPELHDFELDGVDPARVEVALSTRSKGASSGAFAVTVVLSEGGHELRRGVVTARLRSERSLWVAARRLGKGERLEASDLRRERRESRSVPTGATHDLERLVGLQLRRSVNEGRALRVDWLEEPSLVERGQLVRMVLRSSALRIEGVGRAVSDGAYGERIRIVNQDSNREVMGRVVGEGLVHVGF